MGLFMYFITTILGQAVFIIGFVVLIGMIAQKKLWFQILPSVIKTMIGFTMINIGGQTLGVALLPLQPMFSKIFNIQAVPTDIGAAQTESLSEIGPEMALIFAFGFLVNLLLARFTKWKYVHLSAHVSFFYAGLIAALLKFNTSLELIPLVLIGSLLLGFYMTISCAYVAPLMKHIKGGEGFTLAHSSSVGLLISAGLAKLFGNKENDLETMHIPKQFNFLREMTIALTLVMSLLFLSISLVAGAGWVTENISNGQDVIVYSILRGVEFGVWITVILTGVRMMLSEIIPAFHGITTKLIPDSIPGLDIPLLFPHYPTSVIVGFLSSLVAGLMGMLVLGLFNYPIVVFPALIPTFFTGAITGIFGNAFGGRRGALIGSFVNGLILIFGQAFLLPMVGSYAPIMRILSETDYAFYGPLLGLLLKMIGG
ncbi:PTS system, ascorbate-specific IIC component [Carnobacterium iners]|uniref:Ascorbate-specific PTS system EIIC component n=1 Tax=Carnobacterium iners TaxID=1073423 RepID=A0A1X7MRN0_9LACT|nr:PTS ascorbate transporter subunit IIC [Carnobacterium iners]SEK94926.1 PTS system, ascorbate-specific IIC component [Carnobacterium iners]SMH26623.1 PTS system, ascorbate-specific IIC component [Carnobacterium iners]